MTALAIPALRRVATYQRVSSEDQRERETIKTQIDAIDRFLAAEPDVEVVGRYADDGVSGMLAMAERPEGARLLRDARARRFDELVVFQIDRLGRDAADLLTLRRELKRHGVRLHTVVEGQPDDFVYGVHSLLSQQVRLEFLRKTAAGIDRAAREGRFLGGIVGYGYRVEGERQLARIVPDDRLVWSDQTAVDIVRRIYHHIGCEGWSCRQVADELNALGVPTGYVREGRGVREKHTRGVWYAGGIRNLVVNPLYRGELLFGRRTEKVGREVISASIEPLVSAELWEATQKTLGRNRLCAKNTRRVYLLRGVVRCSACGLAYCGSAGKDVWRYRCNGGLRERGPIDGRCPGVAIRGDTFDAAIWNDVERFLRNPGDVLAELDADGERTAAQAIVEAESITLRRGIELLEGQRKQALALNIRGRLPDDELDAELDRIGVEKHELEARLDALVPAVEADEPAASRDLLAEIRARLDAGLSDEERQEIVRPLVRVVVHTEVGPDGRKQARALVTYRFPGVVQTDTATGSWPRRVAPAPGNGRFLGPER
jgi:site-specific DNA recombinase